MDPVTDLRTKLAGLRAMDLTTLRARVTLWRARVDVEDLAAGLSSELDVDYDIVLLVTRAAWTERLLAETADEAAADPDGFGQRVEADTRVLLGCLVCGETTVQDPHCAKAMVRVLALADAGVKIIPVRQLLDQTRCLIGTRA